MKHKIIYPEFMNIKTEDGEVYIGGSQEWYEDKWHKKSGCGPVAASNIVWYIMRKHGTTPDYLKLIREMYDFVTPTLRGVDTSGIFVNGLLGYAGKNNIIITPHVLDIPKRKRDRPDADMLREFIVKALNTDSPVAFLNLSNGTISDLENWHWVTIIAFDPDTMITEISDHGKILSINISEWLESSMLGGSFVYIINETHRDI